MAWVRPSTGLLGRVLVAGAPGCRPWSFDLGPLTALVGPRGSGKSQLMSAIAWLVTGRPRLIPAVDAPDTQVAGELVVDGQVARVARSPEAGLLWEPPRRQRPALPCLLLPAGPGSIQSSSRRDRRGGAAPGGHGRFRDE
jgi:energy-coupling factor transporter ATP-binding protein EcfA2